VSLLPLVPTVPPFMATLVASGPVGCRARSLCLEQNLNDRPTQHQNFPEVPQGLVWDQNQDLALPSLKTVDAYPELTKSSKPTKFIVSPPNLTKDLLEHRNLAKVIVGTRGQSENPQQVEEGQDVLRPDLPRHFVESPDQPPEPTEETESSPQEEAPARHPQPTEEAESPPLEQDAQPAQLPEPPSGEAEPFPPQQEHPVQAPEHHEVTVSPASHHHAQHPNLANGTVKPVDTALVLTLEPIKEVETSPVQQEGPAQTLGPPGGVEFSPTALGAPAPSPEPPKEVEPSSTRQELQAQHAYLTEPTVQPLDLELTVSTEPGDEPSPTMPEALAQPPVGQTQTPVDQEPTTEAEPSTVLQETTSPAAEYPEVTRPYPGPTQATAPPVKKVQSERTAVTEHIDVCELCTCRNETLSCTGLSPNQRPRSVPVPGPKSYNYTFAVLDFEGNSISYIDGNAWKGLRWVEKLILRGNALTELHKDSFKGLSSLRYLDLSCNKIQSIERRTFASLPFLQCVNLGCNLVTEVSFGTFQAWHGMQFLHKLILSRNPLTTVEDSYLYKLPALRSLDLGTTQVSLPTVESILMMTLELEQPILPGRVACCLCRFKNNIEALCKTVKRHCDRCLESNTHADKGTALGDVEGSFVKVLQARKKKTSTELIIEPERPSSGFISPGISSLGEQLEAQLNQQLRPFIPNNDVRGFTSHVIQTLKTDCSEPQAQLSCARLIARTGLLMKLLSEQQEVKASKAEWDTDQWKTENYVNENAEAQGEQKESSELTKEVPGYGYNNKLILAISVIVVVMLLIVIFCLIEVYSRRRAVREGKSLTGAVATGLHHSHSNAGSELHLQTTPQLTATHDP
uniref:Uncharacterized protein n=1 Tax=Catagonus wagneri TaxID=51154 RepID=A0A8C3VDE4_9CETA